VRRRKLCGHGGFRRGEGAVPSGISLFGQWLAIARHVQPGVPGAGAGAVPDLLSGVHGAFRRDCQGVIAIDGKVLRRSFDTASAKSSPHKVSAWGCEQRLVLGQIAAGVKSNEITAVPKLLKMLSLKGCVVTADALNCQRGIARQIVDQGGDYALALKGNQGMLHKDVSTFLDDPAAEAITIHTTVDAGHGRIETRAATISTSIGWLQEHHHWPGLQAIGKIVRTRETGAKTTAETAYYLISATLSAERFGQVVRAHWAVESAPQAHTRRRFNVMN
jgi:predicted transposase YbfD/YdcC